MIINNENNVYRRILAASISCMDMQLKMQDKSGEMGPILVTFSVRLRP